MSAARQLVELMRAIVGDYCPAAPHWIDGREGVYCWRCACRANRKRDKIDGGWSGEEDGPIYCEKCGVLLDFTLTDYGTEETLAGFVERGEPIATREDAYIMLRVLGADGNPILTERCGDWTWGAEFVPQVEKLLAIQTLEAAGVSRAETELG